MRTRKLRGPHKKMSMPFEPFRTHTQPVNVADLEERFAAGDQVTPETLRAAGLAKRRHPVKILARGDLTKKLTVHGHAFSAAAKDKIEKAGGTAELIVDGTSGEAAVQARGLPPRRRPTRRRRSAKPSSRQGSVIAPDDPQLLPGRRDPQEAAFTAAMLLLYRLGAYIPSPGVDINTVKEIEQNFSGTRSSAS